MFKDLTKEVPPIMHVLNIHENLLEALLEMGNYAGKLDSRNTKLGKCSNIIIQELL